MVHERVLQTVWRLAAPLCITLSVDRYTNAVKWVFGWLGLLRARRWPRSGRLLSWARREPGQRPTACKKRTGNDPYGGRACRSVGGRRFQGHAQRLWRQRGAARQGRSLDRGAELSAKRR